MINLLPPFEKEKIIKERKSIIAQAFLILVMIFFVFISLGMICAKISIQDEITIIKNEIAAEEKGSDSESLKNLEAKANEVNSKIGKFAVYYNRKIYFTDIVDEISKTVPDGIYFQNVNMAISSSKASKDEAAKSVIKISVSGFSPTREILFNFKKNIEDKKVFININFPTSNWVKPEKINFFASFELPIK